ncbi:MAG: hypothetical protein U0270_38180 [Labilithrix sp.]
MSEDANHDERQATEELLAGFDRPGRSPRAPAVRAGLDFNATAAAAASSNVASGDTVLVTRRRQRALWPWLVLAFLVSTVLGVVLLTWATRPRPGAEPIAQSATPAVEPAPAAAVESTTPLAPAPAPATAVAPIATTSASSPAPSNRRTPPPPPPGTSKPEHRRDFVPSL